MSAPFVYRRRIQFAETDMAGIVHFSVFYRIMEETEHAFFRSLGLSIMAPQPDGTVIGWPRVRAQCAFIAPAFFEEEIEIEARVRRRGFKSLTMAYLFRRGETVLATGEMKTVCCRCPPGQPFYSIEIPESYAAQLVESDAENRSTG